MLIAQAVIIVYISFTLLFIGTNYCYSQNTLKNATVLRVQIFCSFCLRRHSKQEKLIPAVHNVSILIFIDYTNKTQLCVSRLGLLFKGFQ